MSPNLYKKQPIKKTPFDKMIVDYLSQSVEYFILKMSRESFNRKSEIVCHNFDTL